MSVFVVIVVYYFKKEAVCELSKMLISQGTSVVVVDNTPEINSDNDFLPAGCHYIPLHFNTGIAHAQNIGINYSRERGAEVIFFFDQDSVILDELFISTLLSLLTPGIPGVVGPIRVNQSLDFEYPYEKLNCFGFPVKVYGRGTNKPFVVDSMISSGTGVTAVTFDSVGLMDEDFFIDSVDDEWCMRCRKFGVEILVHPKVVLYHAIGINTHYLGVLTIVVSTPERCYYSMRNAVILFRKSHVPKLFALKSFVSILIHQIAQYFYVNNRSKYIFMGLIGLLHGLRGIKGQKPVGKKTIIKEIS